MWVIKYWSGKICGEYMEHAHGNGSSLHFAIKFPTKEEAIKEIRSYQLCARPVKIKKKQRNKKNLDIADVVAFVRECEVSDLRQIVSAIRQGYGIIE